MGLCNLARMAATSRTRNRCRPLHVHHRCGGTGFDTQLFVHPHRGMKLLIRRAALVSADGPTAMADSDSDGDGDGDSDKARALKPLQAAPGSHRIASSPSLSLGSAAPNEINDLELSSGAYGTTFCR